MKNYVYRPVRFYGFVFVFTWVFWIAAAVLGKGNNNGLSMGLMTIGLFVPAITAIVMVSSSKMKL